MAQKGDRYMRWTVNYTGARFFDDIDGVNTHEFKTFCAAFEMLYDLAQNGFKDAYLKDEEYQCSLYYDHLTNEFYWEC